MGRVGLLQILHLGRPVFVVDGRMGGGDDQGEPEILLPQMACQHQPIDFPRHGNVGDDERNVIVSVKQLKGLVCIGRFQDHICLIDENLDGGQARERLIIDNKRDAIMAP
jgi:hypothetical protein